MNRTLNVVIEIGTAAMICSIILAQHPGLKRQAQFYLRYAIYYAWYFKLPQWKREALLVRGWIT